MIFQTLSENHLICTFTQVTYCLIKMCSVYQCSTIGVPRLCFEQSFLILILQKIELRVILSNIEPNVKLLCSLKQAQVSH